MGRKRVADDETTISARTVCRVLGLSRTALQRLVDAGVIVPRGAGRGKGSVTHYTHSDLTALAARDYYRQLGFLDGWCDGACRVIADVGNDALMELIKRSPARYPEPALWVEPGCWVVRDAKRVYLPGRLLNPPEPSQLAAAQAELQEPLELGLVLAHLDHKIRKLLGLPPTRTDEEWREEFKRMDTEDAAKKAAPKKRAKSKRVKKSAVKT